MVITIVVPSVNGKILLLRTQIAVRQGDQIYPTPTQSSDMAQHRQSN